MFILPRMLSLCRQTRYFAAPTDVLTNLLPNKYRCTTGGARSVSTSPVYRKKDDADTNKKKEIIKLEYELLKVEGAAVPSSLSESNVDKLLAMNSPKRRESFLNYLGTRESKVENAKKEKEIRELIRQKKAVVRRVRNMRNPHVVYDVGFDTLVPHFTPQMKNRFYNRRLARAALFGQKLAVDLNYEMGFDETGKLVRDLRGMYRRNKTSRCPFDLNFCNVKEGLGMDSLRQALKHLGTASCLATVSERSYLDIFPREKLVYLTPDAEETMDEFDHDAIYILGAVVDAVRPLSLAKARREGIRTARFPLEKYLRQGDRNRSLSLYEAIKILQHLKSNGKWEDAVEYVEPKFVPRQRSSRQLSNLYDLQD